MQAQNDDPTPTASGPAGQAVIARQVLLDAQRQIVGYELFDRSLAADAHTAHSDAELLFNLLTHADHAALTGSTTLFINCTHDSLRSGHLELIHPERVVLDVPPLPDDAPAETFEAAFATLKELRRRGFRLAFSHDMLVPAYASWLPLATYIKLDLSQLLPDELKALVSLAREESYADLIAEKVETAEQFAHAQKLGITLFQGYWLGKPEVLSARTLRPAQASVASLLRLLQQRASDTEIEQVFKHDAALAFNLLHFINASGLGLNCEVTSFRHAVMILGLAKLYRWASLLQGTSRDADVSSPLCSAAVARARLMELLAAELLPPEEHENAFLVGLFSPLDRMLGLPLDQALASISLPEAVNQPLLQASGLFAPLLDLVKACEAEDQQAFAQGIEALHLTSQQVNQAHLQALDWAASPPV